MRSVVNVDVTRSRHAARGKRREFRHARDGVVDGRAHEAGEPVDNDLGYRAHRCAEHGRAARHRFDQREAEAFGARGHVHERECAAEQFVTLLAAHVPEKLHRIAVEVRLDLLAEVRLVVRDAGHLQTHAGALRNLDGEVCALLGVEAAEKEQIVAGAIDERERVRIDAVIRGGEIVEARIAVGIADGAVEAPSCARVVRGEDRRR